MSTNLSINFQHHLNPASMESGSSEVAAKIPVQLIPAAPTGERVSVMVPLSGVPATAQLAEDYYSVRATLPNGEVVTGVIDSRDQGDNIPYTLQLNIEGQAPNEDSAWAYLLNKTRRSTHYSQSATQTRKIQCATESTAPATPPAPGAPQIRIWREEGGRFTPMADTEWQQVEHPYRDPLTPLRITLHVPITQRRWLEVVNPDRPSKLVLLPPSPSGRESRCLIVQDTPEGDDTDPWNIVVESANESAATLLAYLQNGSLSAARSVAEDILPQARTLLQGKFRDYAGAVIAGYYLQKVNAWTRPEIAGIARDTWEDWLRNLDQDFPTYSDGAVIRAWRCLTLQQHAHAREHFLSAARRGLPIFRMGTRLLLDGLELLASMKGADEEAHHDADLTYNTDQEVVSALRALRTQAATVEWGTANTTLWGIITAGTGSLHPTMSLPEPADTAAVSEPGETQLTLIDRLKELVGKEDWPAAIELSTELAHQATEPNVKAWAWIQCGNAKEELGQFSEAIADYTRVITWKDAPVDQVATALYNRALVHGKQGDEPSKIDDYTEIIHLKNAPTRQVVAALMNRGIAFGKQDDVASEIKDYTSVIELKDATVEQVAVALLYRGITHGGQGDTVKEIRDYTRIIQLKDAPLQQVATALVNRGITYDNQGATFEAMEDYTQVIQLKDAPANLVAMALVNRGITFGKQGDTVKELRDYANVIGLKDALAAEVAMALIYRGITYASLGKLTQAVIDYEQAINLKDAPSEQVATAHLLLGAAFRELGNQAAARAAYQAALDTPGCPPETQKKAIKALDKLTESHPEKYAW